MIWHKNCDTMIFLSEPCSCGADELNMAILNGEKVVCKHWRELDADSGMEYEYCKLTGNKCYCCGMKSQCSFPYSLGIK